MSKGSEMARRSLGRQLKALRVASGKSVEDVRAIGSRDKIWRMETGKGPFRFADVQSLCIMYGADQQTILRLTDLAAKLSNDSMFEDYTDVLPPWFATYYELEAAASNVCIFEPDIAPGLLQTADYARAIFQAGCPPLAVDAIERLVISRSSRLKNVLAGAPGGQVHAVINEGATMRKIGGEAILAAQLAFLREVSAAPEVEIRVLTWDSGAHAALEGPFHLLQFADVEVQDVVFVENRVGGRYFEKDHHVQPFRGVFASISQQSISLEDYTR